MATRSSSTRATSSGHSPSPSTAAVVSIRRNLASRPSSRTTPTSPSAENPAPWQSRNSYSRGIVEEDDSGRPHVTFSVVRGHREDTEGLGFASGPQHRVSKNSTTSRNLGLGRRKSSPKTSSSRNLGRRTSSGELDLGLNRVFRQCSVRRTPSSRTRSELREGEGYCTFDKHPTRSTRIEREIGGFVPKPACGYPSSSSFVPFWDRSRSLLVCSMASKRILKELKDLQRDPPTSYSAPVATPHLTKQAGKTPANKPNQQTSKSGGSHSCKSCNRTFTSEQGLDSHTKAKHAECSEQLWHETGLDRLARDVPIDIFPLRK
ncbi:ubiquitin-conjugating enzyme E2 8 [Striga asiatica]|uniref:Ubiquitin-conjugating enzyme E2 8 n=1 Tax=Striga asiatica TaxID=4170 RepID=A0A5A7QW55_STRAF|nr:ubiquitin-conjugating enzyme E2 8 [Striga asiatica]